MNDMGNITLCYYEDPQLNLKMWYGSHFVFESKAKVTIRQAFLGIYILFKSDIASSNI